VWGGFRQLNRWLERPPLLTQLALAFVTAVVITMPLFALSAASFGDAIAHATYWAALGVISTVVGHRINQRRRRER
jgi:predicted tellurium resistance membrane protein TerC